MNRILPVLVAGVVGCASIPTVASLRLDGRAAGTAGIADDRVEDVERAERTGRGELAYDHKDFKAVQHAIEDAVGTCEVTLVEPRGFRISCGSDDLFPLGGFEPHGWDLRGLQAALALLGSPPEVVVIGTVDGVPVFPETERRLVEANAGCDPTNEGLSYCRAYHVGRTFEAAIPGTMVTCVGAGLGPLEGRRASRPECWDRSDDGNDENDGCPGYRRVDVYLYAEPSTNRISVPCLETDPGDAPGEARALSCLEDVWRSPPILPASSAPPMPPHSPDEDWFYRRPGGAVGRGAAGFTPREPGFVDAYIDHWRESWDESEH